MGNDTLPSCIGYFGKAVAPNNCSSCEYAKLCKRVVAKERLQAILAKVEEAQAILKRGN